LQRPILHDIDMMLFDYENILCFKDYIRFMQKFELEEIAENIINSYLENQEIDEKFYISRNMIKNFILLFSKALTLDLNKLKIGLKEAQCALIILDYFKSFNIKKIVVDNETWNYKFFQRLDSLLFKGWSNNKNHSELIFSRNANNFLNSITDQIINDLNLKPKRIKKTNEKVILNQILDSINFLSILIKGKEKSNVIENEDIIISIQILHKILFKIPHVYYYSLLDLYRLRYSNKYRLMVEFKIPNEFKVLFNNSRLYHVQKIISKRFPPAELKNIGINNQPISTLINHILLLKHINGKNISSIKNEFQEIIGYITRIIENLKLFNYNINFHMISEKITNLSGDLFLDFCDNGFRKSFTSSAINLITYLKNFIYNIFNSTFGRQKMLFYYTHIPQQIISFIVILGLIDNYCHNEKKVNIKNICEGIRIYTNLLLDSKFE